MAVKLPSFTLFSTADAKSRVFLLFGIVVFISVMGFVAYRYFAPEAATVGPSKVASAPAGLQSVPGSQLSPEYYRALMDANAQAAQQAQITGGTAVPTLVNVPTEQTSAFQSQNCTVLCPNDDNVDVTNSINDLVKTGKLSQADANKLLDLAKRKVSETEYAAALNELVKEGKLTPEEARKLLLEYRKQKQNDLVADNAKIMDGLIKSGQLPLDVANRLLALQKSKISPAEYAAELSSLVRDGKISAATAAQLTAQYRQQQANEATKEGVYQLRKAVQAGSITSEVEKQLADLQDKNVPVDEYADALQRLVAAGKLTPAEADKLLAAYRMQRSLTGATGTIEGVVQQQQNAVATELSDMVQNKKLPQDVADQLTDLLHKNASLDDYKNALGQLVKAGKISPQDAQKLLASYQRLLNTKQVAQHLKDMQGNNVSSNEYADELKRAVQAGLISPQAAANLVQEYRAMTAPVSTTIPTTDTSLPGADDFAKLQQRVQEQAQADVTPTAQTEDFAAAQAQIAAQQEQARAERIQQLQTAMSAQAQSLVAAWQPIKMQHQAGVTSTPSDLAKLENQSSAKSATGTSQADADKGAASKPAIKAGTILFGVLDTTVDSDYPDTPVMVTIVQGPMKGAKLLGKLALAQGKDKVSLNFNLMDREDWLKTKTVSAFAIDPDTARTVMASNVDYHYLKRYGSIMATSFLTGYSSAITQEGTSVTGALSTTSTHPALSPGNKIAVGLGQIGTSLSSVVGNYINTPTTVKVNAGVSLGILFMSDVT